MSKFKMSIQGSQSTIQIAPPPTVARKRLMPRQRYESTTGPCRRCSGLFIRERVIGIHFSGFVMRCINCGSIEYYPVGPRQTCR